MERMYEFRLSGEEISQLKHVALREDAIARLLEAYDETRKGIITVRLTLGEAERIRDCLTLELAMVGFDKAYRPNERGRMLENLIDRFYVPPAGADL